MDVFSWNGSASVGVIPPFIFYMCLSFCFFCSEGNSNKSVLDTKPMLVFDLEVLSLRNYELNTSLLFTNIPLSGIALEHQKAN